MAVTTAQTVDISQALAGLLENVDGLRTYWHVSDATRPPACVIGLPSIDWLDQASGFCRATWTFPLTLVVTRNNDRDAQLQLSRLVMEIANALKPDVPGIFSIEPQDARPTTVTVSGVDQPGYQISVRVRA
jgi:hypothetical protein